MAKFATARALGIIFITLLTLTNFVLALMSDWARSHDFYNIVDKRTIRKINAVCGISLLLFAVSAWMIICLVRQTRPQTIRFDIITSAMLGALSTLILVNMPDRDERWWPSERRAALGLTICSAICAVTSTWYSMTLSYLAFGTYIFVDAQIWTRNLGATPCPISLRKLTDAVRRGQRAPKPTTCSPGEDGVRVCMPGCDCAAKPGILLPPPPYDALTPAGPPAYTPSAGAGPVPGVRLPSRAERGRTVVIAFEECQHRGVTRM